MEQLKQDLLAKVLVLGRELPVNTLDELIDQLGGPEHVAEVSSGAAHPDLGFGAPWWPLQVPVNTEVGGQLQGPAWGGGQKVPHLPRHLVCPWACGFWMQSLGPRVDPSPQFSLHVLPSHPH